jgi:hypothetical protein
MIDQKKKISSLEEDLISMKFNKDKRINVLEKDKKNLADLLSRHEDKV